MVTVSTEHHAILDPCGRLERSGIAVDYVSPRSDGRVAVDDIEAALREETVLLSVMTANNETGVVQPISQLVGLAREHGVLFHTDATQAVGKVPFSARALGVDLVSLSAHKIYGPQGHRGVVCSAPATAYRAPTARGRVETRVSTRGRLLIGYTEA